MTISKSDAADSKFVECSIIIPTLALSERAESLMRAISSVRQDNEASIDIIVVVNGSRFDPALIHQLRAHTEVRLIQISTPSLSAAILTGRQAVRTPFFGFLDDDDEYLPGTVDARLCRLKQEPEASLVVTNGFRELGGHDDIALQQLNYVSNDPLGALFRENWLASCGGLFRTSALPADLFSDIARYLEWTWLAFRIASKGHRVAVVDTMGFRIHDTEISETKSDSYLLAQPEIYQRMLDLQPRRDVAVIITRRLCGAWHDISEHHLNAGRRLQAWRAHLESLRHLCGWGFITYSRRLVFPL